MKRVLFFALLLMSNELFAQNNTLVDSLESHFEEFTGKDKFRAYYEIAAYYRYANPSKADSVITLCFEEAKREGNEDYKSYAYISKAVFFISKGQLDSAKLNAQEALQYAEASLDTSIQITTLNALGNCNIALGNPEKALEYLLKGLRILNTYKNLDQELRIGTNVGWAHLELKQHKECIASNQKTLSKIPENTFEFVKVYCYANMASAYGALGHLDSAIRFGELGYKHAFNTNNLQLQANTLFIVGNSYSDKGDFSKALEYYLKGSEVRQKISNPFFIVSDLYTIADLYYKIKAYDKGIEAGTKALAIAQKHKLDMKLEGIYLALANNYSGIRNYKISSEYYKLWAITKDSMYTKANTKSMAEMRTRFETEKKEQQIKIQELTIAEQEAELKKNRIQVASSVGGIIVLIVVLALLYNAKRLREQVLALETAQKLQSERERISSDLHDHVGAQLTSIISGLQMTETVGGDNQSPQFKQLVESLKEDAKVTITHLRDTIWTLKEEEITPSEFAEHVHRFAESALRYREKPVFSIQNSALSEIKLNPAMALNLTRVVEEAIHNAIKHSGAENLDVNIYSIGGKLQIEVEDNGKGFNIDTKNAGEHYGLDNMKRRMEEVGGKLDIESKLNNYTLISMHIEQSR